MSSFRTLKSRLGHTLIGVKGIQWLRNSRTPLTGHRKREASVFTTRGERFGMVLQLCRVLKAWVALVSGLSVPGHFGQAHGAIAVTSHYQEIVSVGPGQEAFSIRG